MAQTTVRTVEAVCNIALDKIGYPRSIANIYEGTIEARVALRSFGQTRDDLLRMGDWGFAQREVALNLVKTAPIGGYGLMGWTPASPPLPWIYEYLYPDDCLFLRSVRPTPIFVPDYSPRAHVFNIASDPQIGQKVILTNAQRAVAVYTARVIDLLQWEPSFTEALIDSMAVNFQKALMTEPNSVKEREDETARDSGRAASLQG